MFSISSISITIHIFAAIVWVGGMFFAYIILRPSLSDAEPPQRLALWGGRLPAVFPLGVAFGNRFALNRLRIDIYALRRFWRRGRSHSYHASDRFADDRTVRFSLLSALSGIQAGGRGAGLARGGGSFEHDPDHCRHQPDPWASHQCYRGFGTLLVVRGIWTKEACTDQPVAKRGTYAF